MNLVQAEINSGIRGNFRLNQLDLSDPVEAMMYENRRLEEIAAAQTSSGRVILRKRNSSVSAAEKRCLWGC